jgi:molybdate transport repressor ModE-like protein
MMLSHVGISHTYAVELRDLRALLAVTRHGSFTAAAAELGYTQSAVSQQVAALEKELGQTLVERRPVKATPAGARLAEHASRLLLRLDVARSELRHLAQEPSVIRVAASPLGSPWMLAAALRRVRAGAPGVLVSVSTLSPARAVDAVAAGTVDAALIDGIAGPDQPLHLADAGLLASTLVAESGVVVALVADHPLARRRQVDLEVLADAPWIDTPTLSGPPPQAVIGARSDRPAALVYDGDDLSTLLALVSAGLGAALLPAFAVADHPAVVGVPLRHPALVHRTELLTLRTDQATQHPVVRALR